MKTPRWEMMGRAKFSDVDYENGRMNARKVGAHAWQFLEMIDVHSATGEDTGPRYACEVKYVDLASLSPDTIKSAVESCGSPEYASDPRAVAEMCAQYGAAAPLHSENGNNRREVMRAAYRAADDLLSPDTFSDAMARPVNALGSTAEEYMRGDLDAAMARGVESGDPSARLLAKMHGIPDDAINDARPADWLPYLFGYMAGHAGQARDTGPDLAPEYGRGYERGERVRKGEAPAPGWIKSR
jgi:hypothetical protein